MGYATIYQKDAALKDPFGYELACKKFGTEIVNTMPLSKKGKNKGCMRGFILWKNCVRWGWVRTEGGEGYVQYPGRFDWMLSLTSNYHPDTCVYVLDGGTVRVVRQIEDAVQAANQMFVNSLTRRF